MKSLSDILSAEDSGAAQRWELPLFAAAPFGDQTVIGSQLHTAEHLDALEQSAYQEGLQRGHGEGYAAGLRAAEGQALRVAALLDSMHRPFTELSSEIENALLSMTVEVARKLINAELELDPAKVRGAVKEAVASLVATPRELRVHLHPQDLQLLQDTLTLNTEAEWKLVADSTLARGDCLLMTDIGRVDARLDTRQAGITRGLLGEDA